MANLIKKLKIKKKIDARHAKSVSVDLLSISFFFLIS